MEICLQTGNSRKINLNTKAQTPASISLNISSTASSCHRQPDIKAETRICKRVSRWGQRTSQAISRAPSSTAARGPTPIATPPPRSSKTLSDHAAGALSPPKRHHSLIRLFANRIPNCCEEPCWQPLSPRHPSILVGFHYPTPHPQARNRIASLFFHFRLRPSSTTLAKPPVHHRPRSLSDDSHSHFPIDLLGG